MQDLDAAIRLDWFSPSQLTMEYLHLMGMPSIGDAYYSRGLLYSKLGRIAEAEQDFQKAKELGVESRW
jgi:tetratricopeptide (TPR) repeat protein